MVNQGSYTLSISEVVEGALLINNSDSSFLSADPDTLNVIRGLAESFELIVDGVSSLDGGLSVKLSRVRDLEKDILHNIRAVRSLEFKGFAL
jgi:hypothetical protein